MSEKPYIDAEYSAAEDAAGTDPKQPVYVQDVGGANSLGNIIMGAIAGAAALYFVPKLLDGALSGFSQYRDGTEGDGDYVDFDVED